MRSRTITLVVGFLLGVVVTFGATSLPLGAADETPTAQVFAPGYDVATSTGCGEPQDGWLTVTPLSGATVVIINLTVAHESTGLDHTYDLRELEGGDWVLFITTSPTDEKPPTAGCTSVTTYDISVTLPGDYGYLTVVRDDERVVELESTGGTATYRPLSA
jgi:hypothetical protein